MLDVNYIESLARVQKRCEKNETGYMNIKQKSKQLYEDYKMSLKKNDKNKKLIEELKTEILNFKEKLEIKENQLVLLKNKAKDMKKFSGLTGFKSSFNSIQSLNIHNEM